MLSRRQVLGGLLVSGVAGCASNSNSVVDLFSKTVSSKTPSPDQYPLSDEQIRAIPYATMGIRIGDFPRAVLVLATVDGPDLQWVSSDHVSFFTRDGVLVRTHGLGRDLAATRWKASDAAPLAGITRTGTLPAPGAYREIDLKHADETAISVESRFEEGREEAIVILGRERQVRRIDEIAVMPAWRWKTRNSFWIDPQSGRVWRSVQQYCPEMPPIALELLKAPAAAAA